MGLLSMCQPCWSIHWLATKGVTKVMETAVCVLQHTKQWSYEHKSNNTQLLGHRAPGQRWHKQCKYGLFLQQSLSTQSIVVLCAGKRSSGACRWQHPLLFSNQQAARWKQNHWQWRLSVNNTCNGNSSMQPLALASTRQHTAGSQLLISTHCWLLHCIAIGCSCHGCQAGTHQQSDSQLPHHVDVE